MKFLDKILASKIYLQFRKLIPNNMVNSFKHLPLAILANAAYGFPSKELKIIGVTGTNGKTTTATTIYDILHRSGKKVALISTVEAKFGNKKMDTGLHVTSPSPWDLQKILRKIVTKGYRYLVLETTSHGFVQHRLWGVDFEIGVMTNLTEDHLDYHKTMAEYAKAKSKLFQHSQISVLNIDDPWFETFKKSSKSKIITYGWQKGDYQAKKLAKNYPLPGKYNQMNAVAALAVADLVGIDLKEAQKNLQKFSGILGRMQVVYDKDYKVIVDFAHTPDGLDKALTTLKKDLKKPGRLISVFGCAGLRDKKRRKMGFYSAKFADITIITAEDPRSENIKNISDEIASWAKKARAKYIKDVSKFKNGSHVYTMIDDRRQAIAKALKIAKKNDIVGIFGKGHEKSLAIGTEEIPWSDQKVVAELLKIKK